MMILRRWISISRRTALSPCLWGTCPSTAPTGKLRSSSCRTVVWYEKFVSYLTARKAAKARALATSSCRKALSLNGASFMKRNIRVDMAESKSKGDRDRGPRYGKDDRKGKDR